MLHGMIKNGNVFGLLLSGVIFTVSAAQQTRFKPIDERRIIARKSDIEEYFKAVESDVWKGKMAGEWVASCWGISSRTFKAMPVEFFNDSQGVKDVLSKLTTKQLILYMDQAKKDFINQCYPEKKKFTRNIVAGFFHDRMVDNLEGLTYENKSKLKHNPSLIMEFLKDPRVKSQYMSFTGCNIVTQLFIEEELGKKAN